MKNTHQRSMSRLGSIGLVALLTFSAMSASADSVNIAVAANFTDVTRVIAPLFEKATGHKLKVSFGSTGKLYSQIENGAPFEVFLAADIKRPIKAERAGLAVEGSRFTYAVGKLALWSVTPNLFTNAIQYLKEGAYRRVAIANPKTAPYGFAAKEVIEHIGAWDALQTRLVRGDSIAQTFQFVATSNAEIGFIALSQAKGWQGGSGTLWEIPQGYYTPIEQQAVLLNKGANSEAAVAFVSFLKSKKVQAVITKYGYGVK